MQRLVVLLVLATVFVAITHWPLTVVAAEPPPPEQANAASAVAGCAVTLLARPHELGKLAPA